MAYLAVINRGYDTAGLYVMDLNLSTTYKTVYIQCNGYASPNLAKSYVSQNSETWTVPGLSCGRRYDVQWQIESKGGSTATGSGSFQTLECPIDHTVGDIYWFTANPNTQIPGQVSLSWASAENATSYELHLWKDGYIPVGSYSTPYTSYIVSNLIQGGSYDAIVWGKRAGEMDGPQSSRSFTMPTFRSPPGQPGAVTLTPSTSTDGVLYVSWGYAFDADDYLVTIYRSNGTYVTDTSTLGNSVTFSGLTIGWTYYVIVVPRNTAGNGSSRTSLNITIPEIKRRPANWQWDSAKSSGGTLNIMASEWNRFLNRIDDFRAYKKLSAGTYSYASMSSTITANQYNQARLAISSMGAVPYAVSAGATINASEFNNIRDYLNTIN
ncbi:MULTISPECIES: fibronectin type III domain-containing protein [unclassified Sporosarcina]|uniref:fibronectin type III domain-containing protein n=1 Tax=unclassified Sporosarcina TaxID=2647733 RepID=UPI0020425E62|nr:MULTISPECIES: fibronectin type III domain-containing protein [unclassified Sporosarcina]GKV64670.1 hypothetical protein NCCP2331_08230 [Sporosarcina sp. NCCP-2331]GLB54457.1 hypothetical protein NCCP2378_02420 [Sporosarcina sp. NCCP-2378]